MELFIIYIKSYSSHYISYNRNNCTGIWNQFSALLQMLCILKFYDFIRNIVHEIKTLNNYLLNKKCSKFNFLLFFQCSFILLNACTTFLTLSDIIKLIQISIWIVIMSNIFNGTTRLFFCFINLVTISGAIEISCLEFKNL